MSGFASQGSQPEASFEFNNFSLPPDLASNLPSSFDTKTQDNNKSKASGKHAKKNQVQPESKKQGVTTVMIRHIPCRLSQQDLVELLDKSGFEDKFNFLHLPVAAPMARTFTSNLGYCFINFSEPEFAKEFQEKFAGSRLGVSLSSKECEITTAHVQGLEANLRHFKRVTRSKSYHKPYIKTCGDDHKKRSNDYTTNSTTYSSNATNWNSQHSASQEITV
jgi:hypothetical protein